MVLPVHFFARGWALAALIAVLPVQAQVQAVTIGGVTFSNKGLVGAGRIAHDKKDRYGETFGSLSGLALDVRAWSRNASGSTFSGTLYAQPDRGYVKSGVTTNYRSRTNRLTFTFKPDSNGSSNQDQLALTLADTTILTEADGTPLTGMDASATASGTRAGFPKLPQAFNGRISLDAEGLVLLPDGTFFICDEYGPYLYRFSASGVLLGAIRPPEALIPKRSNVDSFSSDNPATLQPAASPSDPTAGRANNKGLEGLAVSADGRTLYALIQAATRQDTSSGQNRFARMLRYDITSPASLALTGEWVLPLPLFTANPQDVAEAHELLVLDSRRFLVLAHDGNGRGATVTKSTYRAVLVYDIFSATDIHGGVYDSASSPLAVNGVLANNITPATSGVLVDMTDSAQLSKFGLNNSANDDSNTLSSAWESLALAPALDAANPDDYFLFIGNDNNFSTNGGFQDSGSYNASPNIDSMILAYRVTLPGTPTIPSIITPPSNTTVAVNQSATLSVVASGSPAPSYQWSRNGTAIVGATSASLAITNAGAADVASYTVTLTNANGSVTSAAVALAVTGANIPTITAQPVSPTVAIGSTAVFSVTATNTLSYQWRLNGVNISSSTTGATGPTLVLVGATAAQAGVYSVVVTNGTNNVTSQSATLTIVAATDVGRLSNLSVLTDITATVPNFTLGTVVAVGSDANGKKPLVVRAVGPSLGALGVPNTIADPKVDLLAGQTVVATNDNWGGVTEIRNAMASVGAFSFASDTTKDAAIYSPSLPPRDYTVSVSGVGGATGTVIAEIYDATPIGTFTSATPRLINVSVLKQINANGFITLGFTIGGSTAKTVLIRAIGPGLAAVGVPTSATVADPQLTLFNSASAVIATNDNWGGDAALTTTMTRVSAFGGFSGASKDAMLLVTLQPGGYTARASDTGPGSGLVIVEAYEVP